MAKRILAIALVAFSMNISGQPVSERAMRDLQRMKAEDYFPAGVQVQLIEAADANDLSAIRLAIDGGADLDFRGKDGITPLLWALVRQNYEGFVSLLREGANPNVVTVVDARPATRESVIHTAAMAEDSRYLEAALDHGGDPDLVKESSSAYSPLYTAILHNRTENVDLLLHAGANINHRDLSGGTPLMSAVSIDAYEIALLLMERGADVSAKNRWGSDVVTLVERYGNLRFDEDSEGFAEYQRFVNELRSLGLME